MKPRAVEQKNVIRVRTARDDGQLAQHGDVDVRVLPLIVSQNGKSWTTCRAGAITRELRIDKVGVRGLRFPIQVRDKALSIQNTVATIGMFVDLPKEFKGTHMSRFVEALNAHGSVIHVENIMDILCCAAKTVELSHVAPGN
jgi:hypothetical protein